MSDPGQGTEVCWPDFEFGPEVTGHGLTFFPILDREGRDVDYLLLQEAIQEKVARVQEVSEEGSVPVLEVENRHDRPVLALQGEELVGAKQDRTLNVSILLPPGRTRVPVTCVEQGRWGYKSREFYTGTFEHYALRRMKAEQVSASRMRSVVDPVLKYAANQSAVWHEVSSESARQAVTSRTGALGDVYGAEGVKTRLDAIEKDMRLPAGTRGVAVAVEGEVVAVEVLESPGLFMKVWPRLLRSYALGSIAKRAMGGKESGRKADRQAAEKLTSSPRGVPASSEDSVGLGRDVRWEPPGALAVGLFHECRMVHGTIYRKARAQDLGLD